MDCVNASETGVWVTFANFASTLAAFALAAKLLTAKIAKKFRQVRQENGGLWFGCLHPIFKLSHCPSTSLGASRLSCLGVGRQRRRPRPSQRTVLPTVSARCSATRPQLPCAAFLSRRLSAAHWWRRVAPTRPSQAQRPRARLEKNNVAPRA